MQLLRVRSLGIEFPNARAERNLQNDLMVLFKNCHQNTPKEKENGPFIFLISNGKSPWKFLSYTTENLFLICKNTFSKMLNLIPQWNILGSSCTFLYMTHHTCFSVIIYVYLLGVSRRKIK